MPLPDASWTEKVNGVLYGDADWKKAVATIGDPLYLKVKSDDESASVLLQIGDAETDPAVTLLDTDRVEADNAIIVSMKHETWDRLLRGSADLMTVFMSREIKAKASMFKLMKITDPAETLIQKIGVAQKGVGA